MITAWKIDTSMRRKRFQSRLKLASAVTNDTRKIESWLSDKEVEIIYDDIKNVNYEEILFHKVDKAVNNTKNTNASLIKKFEEVPF